jgi:2,5-diketo-D-gluconate reductase A
MTFSPEQMPLIKLNTGQQMPQLGLGVYKVGQTEAVDLIRAAIGKGYRRVDTAALYGNEAEVGEGIRTSGVAREDLFVTTKIWNDRQGYDSALEAIDESLTRLDIDYVDLLLVHWPCPKQDKFVETWSAFQKAMEGGKIRGIGVSNFNPHHLEKLMASGGPVPAINQIELHPGWQQKDIRAYNASHGIATEAWSPLARGRYNESAEVLQIAKKHGKTPTQVVVRWHIELGNLVIPKTSNHDRLDENIDVFDFKLDAEDMALFEKFDGGERVGPNPDDFG